MKDSRHLRRIQRLSTSVTLPSRRVVWRALDNERAPGTCAVHGCGRIASEGRRGLCHTHYKKISKAGGLDRIADHPKRRARPMHAGMLYAVADGHGHIKIGFTRSLQKRLRTIQAYQALPVTLIASWPGSPQDETAFHAAASAMRVQGEWYTDCPSIRGMIDKHAGIQRG